MSKKTTRSAAPEFLADLLTFTTEVLIAHGLTEEDANIAARNVCKKTCGEWGGQLIYFPYWLREELSERDLKIYAEFNGNNHQALSRKHKLSIQQIYRIVEFMRNADIASRQPQLDLES